MAEAVQARATPTRPHPSCALCGLPLGSSRAQKTFGEELLRFCCPGCLHVFDLLFHRPGGRPADFSDTDLYRACLSSGLIARSPEPAEQTRPEPRPGPEEGPGAELAIALGGMWCTACAWVLEQALRKTPGVSEASVFFSSDLARVQYLPHRVAAEAILNRVRELGYGAERFEDPQASGELRRQILNLGISAILSMNTMMISFVLYTGFFTNLGSEAVRVFSWLLFATATPAVFWSGAPIFRRAWACLRAGTASMDTLIAVGALAAYGFSLAELRSEGLRLYFDTAAMLVTVVLFGRFVECRARQRVTRGIGELYRMAHAKTRLCASGVERWVAPGAVSVGDELIVRAGETVPVDGRIQAGSAELDESALTGESLPIERSAGEEVRAGARLLGEELRLRVTRIGSESSLGQTIRVVEEGLKRKSRLELLADRWTRRLVPAVITLAALTTLVLVALGTAPEEALLRAVAVLVITCPCALGLATPLAKAAATAVAREAGILVRDPAAIERAGALDAIVFDKTGTVTEGRFALRQIIIRDTTKEEALGRIASLEACSEHFLGREIVRRALDAGLEPGAVEGFDRIEALGVRGRVAGVDVFAGNRKLLGRLGIGLPPELDEQSRAAEGLGLSAVFGGWSGAVKVVFVLGDRVRDQAAATIARLQARGIEIRLVSGDSEQTTESVARELGIAWHRGGAAPEDKVGIVRELQAGGRRVGMVGDGLNDAAALAQADVGFAMGCESNVAEQAADFIILNADLNKVMAVQALSRRAARIFRQNLVFAFFYNALGIPLAVLGLLNPFLAAAAMLASSLSVVGNTARILRADP